MPRAILKDGVIHPLEPLPAEWEDGRELWVDEAPEDSPEAIEQWYQKLETMVAETDPEDASRLQIALAEIKREGKEAMRREMGLSP
jgi:hypothetical protein